LDTYNKQPQQKLRNNENSRLKELYLLSSNPTKLLFGNDQETNSGDTKEMEELKSTYYQKIDNQKPINYLKKS
jgi:hypothetical protein